MYNIANWPALQTIQEIMVINFKQIIVQDLNLLTEETYKYSVENIGFFDSWALTEII